MRSVASIGTEVTVKVGLTQAQKNMKDSGAETKLKVRLSKSFSAFRQGSGTPPWLVSETATDTFISQSDKWVHLLPAIGFGQTLSCFRDSPGFEQIASERITEESRRWTECNQIRDALLAAYRLLISANELRNQGKLTCPTAVLKTLPVLGTMFWCPEGSRIVAESARVLGCGQATPAEVFEAYRRAIESGDTATLLELERLFDSDPVFSSWATEFSIVAVNVNLPESPSPLPFTGLVPAILLTMLETEVKDDNNR